VLASRASRGAYAAGNSRRPFSRLGDSHARERRRKPRWSSTLLKRLPTISRRRDHAPRFIAWGERNLSTSKASAGYSICAHLSRAPAPQPSLQRRAGQSTSCCSVAGRTPTSSKKRGNPVFKARSCRSLRRPTGRSELLRLKDIVEEVETGSRSVSQSATRPALPRTRERLQPTPGRKPRRSMAADEREARGTRDTRRRRNRPSATALAEQDAA